MRNLTARQRRLIDAIDGTQDSRGLALSCQMPQGTVRRNIAALRTLGYGITLTPTGTYELVSSPIDAASQSVSATL